MAKTTVLFTGGGGSASQSIQAQWGERYTLVFADANPHGFPPSIPAAAREIIPFANAEDFAPKLLEICQRRGVDVIVPGVDEELAPLAKLKGAAGWPEIMVPSAEFVTLMLDKLRAAEAIAAAGLTAPKTVLLEHAEELPFPIIAKPRTGRGSRGVMKLDHPNQAPAYLALQGLDPDLFIAQELGGGDEYTVFVAGDRTGALRAVIPVRAYEKRGVTIRARTERQKAIIDYAAAFQAHFKESGVYNIQCMLTPDGVVLPFEVNPRISTTFVLGVATGFDPIATLYADPLGDDLFLPEGEWRLQRSWLSHIEKA